MSVPGLELVEATIGARPYDSLKKSCRFITFTIKLFWSDSSSVLTRIRRENSWGVFRVTELKRFVDSLTEITGGMFQGIVARSTFPPEAAQLSISLSRFGMVGGTQVARSAAVGSAT